MNSKFSEFLFQSIRHFTTAASIFKQLQNPQTAKALAAFASVAGAAGSIVAYVSLHFQQQKLELKLQHSVEALDKHNELVHRKEQELDQLRMITHEIRADSTTNNLIFILLCITCFTTFYIAGRRKASRMAFDKWILQESKKNLQKYTP